MSLFFSINLYHFNIYWRLNRKFKTSFGEKLHSNKTKDFSCKVIEGKQEYFSEKVTDYMNSLPKNFIKDKEGPPIFSYPWLQRLGRMDIFSEKMESKREKEEELLSYDLVKSDPIFRIPKKKKKNPKKLSP